MLGSDSTTRLESRLLALRLRRYVRRAYLALVQLGKMEYTRNDQQGKGLWRKNSACTRENFKSQPGAD